MRSQLLHPTTAPPPVSGEACAQAEINLDLGIGRCGLGDVKIEQAKSQLPFSVCQLHPSFNQVVVCNWIVCGLPVPVTLFFPTCFNIQSCDQSVEMDCEPGRCRRTDGRKWRCSRSVIPGQKYCERHVHRGRQRQGSRKRVEPVGRVAKSDNHKIPDYNRRKHLEPTENVAKSHTNKLLHSDRVPVIPSLPTRVHDRLDVSGKGDRDLGQHCLNNVNGNPTIVDESCNPLVVADSAILGLEGNKNGLEGNKNGNGDSAITSMGANSVNNGLTDDGDGKMSGNVYPTKINRRKPSVTRNSYHGFVSPGFGLSPRSVLHSGAGKAGLDLDSKSVAAAEQQRCRRTDGKKWQCRRDTIPGEKYCEAHMHRGAKRIKLHPESAGNIPTASARSPHISGTTDDRINLNTMPVSPQHTTGNNSTSSTSDATTITDENVSFCLKHRNG